MRVSLLTLGVVAACWSVGQAVFIGAAAPALLVTAVIGLKAAVFATVYGPFKLLPLKGLAGIGKRSVSQGDEAMSQNLLLTTVTQLDPNGCILKLLCNLQTKAEVNRTSEEQLLGQLFTDDSDSVTSYNAPFVYAVGVGRQTRDPATCNKLFSQCPMEEEQLDRILQRAWGCGLEDLE